MDQPIRMLPNLAVSAAVHAAIAAAMIGYVANQEIRVGRQETVVREELARTERVEAEQAQDEARAATRDLIREQVRQEVVAELSAQVQATQPLAKLTEAADAAVQAELAKIEEKTPLDAMDEAALAATAQALHDAAIDAAGEAIAATLHEELIERIRTYTRTEAVPEVRRRIEHALADRVGGEMRKAAEESVRKTIPGKDDDAAVVARRQAAMAGALATLAPQVATAVTAAVTSEAVPRTTDVLVKALAEPIARAGLERAAVEDAVRETITSALSEGLKADAPEDQAALAQLRDAAQASDPAAIAAAAEQAAAAAKSLNAAAAAEEAIAAKAKEAAAKDGAEREAASAALAAEAAAATSAATAAVAKAGDAVQSATAATAQARDRRDQAAEHASDRRITDGAAAAQANLEHQAPQDAVNNAGNAAREARQAADSLAQLSSSLASAAAAAKQSAGAKAADTKSADAKSADASSAAAASAAAKAMSDSLTKAVAESASAVDGGRLAGAVDALSKGGSISQLANLRDRLGGKDADAAARSTSTVSRLTGSAAAAMAAGGNGASGGRGRGPATLDGSAVKRDAKSVRSTREAKDEAWKARYNRAAYEAFTKDLVGRTDPANFYGAGASQSALVPTAASITGSPAAASAYLDTAWREERERMREAAYTFKADPKRVVPAPAFKTIAFAGALLQDRPLTIDGDLADWGPLRLPMTTKYGPYSSQPVEGGPSVYMRWSPAGLYFGYRVDMDPAEIVGNPDVPYDGDCLELFIDTENTRKENMRDSSASHQFCFLPFGFQGNRAMSVCEVGRGLRGIPQHTYQWRQDGAAVAKIDERGYTVECFLPRMALAKRTLLPGQYLAINLSVNRGLKSDKAKQWDQQRAWSASKEIGSWDKPSTWGDVLLLGSDAEVAIAPLATGGSDDAVTPGQPIQVEVRDADMDLSPHVADRVLGTVRVRGGQPVAVILGETGPATGVFRATLDTRSYVLPPLANAVGVRAGDVIEFSYIDARTAGGEKDRQVEAILGVAYPMSKLAIK